MKKLLLTILSSIIFVSACQPMGKEEAKESVSTGEVKEESMKEEEDDMQVGNFSTISVQEAKKLMQTEENYIILDVRTKEEYESGHIPGAINLPNEEIAEAEISLLKDKEDLILVYCRSGNRSRQAAEKLANLGYSNVKDFGGINSWDGEIVK